MYINFKSLLVSTLLIGFATIFTFYVLRRTGPHWSHRLPSLLVFSVPLLLFGAAMLPEALPSLFASILHYSITSDYVHPIQADGIQVTESWILTRWWEPIGEILYAAVSVGMIWAVWNIFRSHGRKFNLFAFCLGLLWTELGIFVSLQLLAF